MPNFAKNKYNDIKDDMWLAWLFALLAILAVVISVSVALGIRSKENIIEIDTSSSNINVNSSDESAKQNKRKKFIYHKGIEGFGDRLQPLLEVIETAERTGRTVVVDWEDPHWCHDTRYSFDYFFKINDVKYMTKKSFLVYAKRNNLTFYPKYWTEKT